MHNEELKRKFVLYTTISKNVVHENGHMEMCDSFK